MPKVICLIFCIFETTLYNSTMFVISSKLTCFLIILQYIVLLLIICNIIAANFTTVFLALSLA